MQSRRLFLQSSLTTLGLAGLGLHSSSAAPVTSSPNEKLRIAIIGTANRARANIDGVKHEEIHAICDIDAKFLAKMQADFPKAKPYADFRKLYDELHKEIDAVVVSTADHTHAPATFWAMQLGKHAYCEKPLTHTVKEARQLAELAAKQKVATQMGTQIHAGDNYRRVVELIRAGAIGAVKEVHTWVGKGWGGGDRPKDQPPIPEHISWDLWLGPAMERPYHSQYLPANWRRYWAFGGGTLGDMACHHMDLPFWALDLRAPSKVKATGPAVHAETCPVGLQVDYTFAATDKRPELVLHWYDGNQAPKTINGIAVGGGGNLFIGEKGMLFADYGRLKLYPEDQFKDFKAPEKTIPASTGHYIEWITACKTGSPTTCNFDYSGALTETVLLGNVAYRTGTEIQWDAAKLQVTNSDAANALITKEYRQGWELKS